MELYALGAGAGVLPTIVVPVGGTLEVGRKALGLPREASLSRMHMRVAAAASFVTLQSLGRNPVQVAAGATGAGITRWRDVAVGTEAIVHADGSRLRLFRGGPEFAVRACGTASRPAGSINPHGCDDLIPDQSAECAAVRGLTSGGADGGGGTGGEPSIAGGENTGSRSAKSCDAGAGASGTSTAVTAPCEAAAHAAIVPRHPKVALLRRIPSAASPLSLAAACSMPAAAASATGAHGALTAGAMPTTSPVFRLPDRGGLHLGGASTRRDDAGAAHQARGTPSRSDTLSFPPAEAGPGAPPCSDDDGGGGGRRLLAPSAPAAAAAATSPAAPLRRRLRREHRGSDGASQGDADAAASASAPASHAQPTGSDVGGNCIIVVDDDEPPEPPIVPRAPSVVASPAPVRHDAVTALSAPAAVPAVGGADDEDGNITVCTVCRNGIELPPSERLAIVAIVRAAISRGSTAVMDDGGLAVAEQQYRLNDLGELQCGHRFCFDCISQWADISTTCCLCKTAFRSIAKLQWQWSWRSEGDGAPTRLHPYMLMSILAAASAGGNDAVAESLLGRWTRVDTYHRAVRRQHTAAHEAEDAALAVALAAAEDDSETEALMVLDDADDDAGEDEMGDGHDWRCRQCGRDDDDARLMLCSACDAPWHTVCLTPPLTEVPEGHWCCPPCETVRSSTLEYAGLPISEFVRRMVDQRDSRRRAIALASAREMDEAAARASYRGGGLTVGGGGGGGRVGGDAARRGTTLGARRLGRGAGGRARAQFRRPRWLSAATGLPADAGAGSAGFAVRRRAELLGPVTARGHAGDLLPVVSDSDGSDCSDVGDADGPDTSWRALLQEAAAGVPDCAGSTGKDDAESWEGQLQDGVLEGECTRCGDRRCVGSCDDGNRGQLQRFRRHDDEGRMRRRRGAGLQLPHRGGEWDAPHDTWASADDRDMVVPTLLMEHGSTSVHAPAEARSIGTASYASALRHRHVHRSAAALAAQEWEVAAHDGAIAGGGAAGVVPRDGRGHVGVAPSRGGGESAAAAVRPSSAAGHSHVAAPAVPTHTRPISASAASGGDGGRTPAAPHSVPAGTAVAMRRLAQPLAIGVNAASASVPADRLGRGSEATPAPSLTSYRHRQPEGKGVDVANEGDGDGNGGAARRGLPTPLHKAHALYRGTRVDMRVAEAVLEQAHAAAAIAGVKRSREAAVASSVAPSQPGAVPRLRQFDAPAHSRGCEDVVSSAGQPELAWQPVRRAVESAAATAEGARPAKRKKVGLAGFAVGYAGTGAASASVGALVLRPGARMAAGQPARIAESTPATSHLPKPPTGARASTGGGVPFTWPSPASRSGSSTPTRGIPIALAIPNQYSAAADTTNLAGALPWVAGGDMSADPRSSNPSACPPQRPARTMQAFQPAPANRAVFGLAGIFSAHHHGGAPRAAGSSGIADRGAHDWCGGMSNACRGEAQRAATAATSHRSGLEMEAGDPEALVTSDGEA